ncbi:C40 family peptidase [Streptomyces albicerus]|uniref:C40 family peptidase n=1 Tax=Streptomyces albicerus TaxID=2569859 RepID=UPI00124B4834|nr:C40 family peptidase [Streptomyces albicerus]
MTRPALATAASTSVDLFSAAGGGTPAPGGDAPSREEVQQRISSLYDQAESATGNYNATRATTTGPRNRVKPERDSGRGRPAPERTDAAPERTGTTLGDVAKQWFDVGRTQLGPIVPAVLPPDRMPDRRPAEARPKSPAGRPGDRPTGRDRESAGKPVLELTAGPATRAVAGPVAELTAGPVAELTAGPFAALPAVPEPRQEIAKALPAPVAEPQQSLRTSKERIQRKLASARELLSGHAALRSTPVAAIEPPRVESTWRTSVEQEYPPAWEQWWQPQPEPQLQPQPAGLDTALTAGTVLSIDTALSIDTGMPIRADGVPDPGYGGKAAKAIDFARGQIGKPCVWGATGPDSYDCSSLIQSAWKAAGVALPRNVLDQVTAGTAVTLADLRLGDLIFFHGTVGHVGLYIGNSTMIHAPSPGASIREESIYWAGEAAIHGAVRPA